MEVFALGARSCGLLLSRCGDVTVGNMVLVCRSLCVVEWNGFQKMILEILVARWKKSSFDAIINHRQNYGYRRIDLLLALEIRVIDTGL
jgi:hypothetical protein